MAHHAHHLTQTQRLPQSTTKTHDVQDIRAVVWRGIILFTVLFWGGIAYVVTA